MAGGPKTCKGGLITWRLSGWYVQIWMDLIIATRPYCQALWPALAAAGLVEYRLKVRLTWA